MTTTVAVAVDHTKVAADLTDFPLFVDLGDMPSGFWSTVVDGGGDIRCYDASSNPLAREVVSCDTGTQTGELWVKCDLSSTVDTALTVTVDGTSTEPAAASTYGSQAVWPDYDAVWHFATADSINSAGSSHNLSGRGGPTTATGKIGTGGDVSVSYRRWAIDTFLASGSTALTLSAWMKPSAFNGDGNIIRSGALATGTVHAGFDRDGWPYARMGGSASYYPQSGWRPTIGAWSKVDVVYTDTVGLDYYANGGLQGSKAYPASALPADFYLIAAGWNDISSERVSGVWDEIRLSAVARTADWIATEYANQSAPATFYLIDGVAPRLTIRPQTGVLTVDSPAPTVTQRDQYFTLDAATIRMVSGPPLVKNHGDQTIIVEAAEGDLRLGGGGIVLAAQEVAIDWNAPAEVEVRGLYATLTTPPIPEVVPAPSAGSGFDVVTVDNTGATTGALSVVNVKEIIWTLNDSDQATVEVPKYASSRMCKPVVDCFKISFNGATLFNGPIIPRGASSSGGVITYHARGADWFLTKRRLGMPPVTGPYLPNGGFEDGSNHWAIRQGAGSAIVQPSPALGGTHLLRMRWDGPPKMGSSVAPLAPAARAGYLPHAPFMGRWTVEAWCRINVIRETVGSGHMLSLAGTPGTTTDVLLPSDAPRGKWFRITADALCGPGGVINVTLFGIGGNIDWDEVRLFDSGTWGPVGWHTDTAEVAKIAIDTAQVRSDFGLGTAGGPSGVAWPEAEWQVADHTTWDQIVRALAAYGDGFDWSVDVSGGDRVWTSHAPRKGVDRGITLVPGTHIASYDWNDDGSQLVSALIVQGQGPDGNKTESGYTDAGMFGGLELHDVLQADEGTPIDDLPKTAEDWVDQSETANDQLTVVCHNESYDFVTGIDTGDRVGVSISDGAVPISGQWRIVQKKLNGHDLTVELTLTKEPT